MNSQAERGVARVARLAAEHATAVDQEGRFPAEAVAAMKQDGLLGGMVPVDLGGRGLSLSEVAAEIHALARACASSGMILAMHQIQVACIVVHGLRDPWHRAFAQEVAAEQLLLASVTSEAGIGGDMRSSACAVGVEGERFTLAKQAPTISYGAYADGHLITARRAADAPASDQVLVTLRKGDSRLERTGGWDALGMRGTCSEGFVLEAAGNTAQILPVPFAEIAAETMVPVSHLLWGAVWTGIAGDAVTRARSFLRAQARRKPGLVPPGATRLAQAAGMLQMMQARLRFLLRQYDAAHPPGDDTAAVTTGIGSGWPSGMTLATEMNTLKHDIADMAQQAVHHALLICGMAGYKNGGEYSVGRHLRDIYSAQLMISNDRIALNTGAMLLAQRAELGTL